MKTQSAKASATKPQHSNPISSAPKKPAPTPLTGLFAAAATSASTTMPAPTKATAKAPTAKVGVVVPKNPASTKATAKAGVVMTTASTLGTPKIASTTTALTTTTTTTTTTSTTTASTTPTTTYNAPHSQSLSLDKLILNIESHYNKNNDFKPLINSLKKLLGNKIKIDKNDNKNIQKLDLILRINGFPENLNALHNLMEKHKIAIIPFLNEDLVNNFESILKELENNELLPPNFSKSKEKWKKKPWSESDISKVEFHRVKKEVSSNITEGDRDEKHVSFCSVFLSQEIEKEIIESLEGDQQKLEKTVGFRNYVIDGAQGTWIRQRHTAADHVQPFSIIRKRVQTLFKFINNDTSGLLKDLIVQKYAQYFIMGKHTKEVFGTKYLYMSLYNYLDNLWLMDHSINSTEKGEIDPIEWLQKNDNFGEQFALFISDHGETEISDLVDKQFIIYTLKKNSIIKEKYQGETLGKVARDWIKMNPEILVKILELEYSHSRSEQLLYLVRDLLKDENFKQEDRDELQKKLEKFNDQLNFVTAARNELREAVISLLNNYQIKLSELQNNILKPSPLKKEFANLLGKNKELSEKLKQEEQSSLAFEKELAVSKGNLAASENELLVTKDKLSQTEDKLAASVGKLAVTEDKLRVADNKNLRLEEEVKKLRSENEKLKRQIKSQK